MDKESKYFLITTLIVGLIFYVLSIIIDIVLYINQSEIFFGVFSIVGLLFIYISLFLLYKELFWIRDIVMFILLIIIIAIKLFINFYIIEIIILDLFLIISFFDFIKNLKKYPYNQLQDIKNEIKIFKKPNNRKKEYLTEEEQVNKSIKKIRIIICILFFSFIPLGILLSALNVFPNDTIYNIYCFISFLFSIIGLALIAIIFDRNYNSNNLVMIKGKIKESKPLNIVINVIIINLIIFLLIFIQFLIFVDPLGLYLKFNNPLRMQIFSTITYWFIITIFILLINRNKCDKKSIIFGIIIFIILYILGYIITI